MDWPPDRLQICFWQQVEVNQYECFIYVIKVVLNGSNIMKIMSPKKIIPFSMFCYKFNFATKFRNNSSGFRLPRSRMISVAKLKSKKEDDFLTTIRTAGAGVDLSTCVQMQDITRECFSGFLLITTQWVKKQTHTWIMERISGICPCTAPA